MQCMSKILMLDDSEQNYLLLDKNDLSIINTGSSEDKSNVRK